MTEVKTVELQDLVGLYNSIAIDHFNEYVNDVKHYYDDTGDCFAFQLGDNAYVAFENPDDGYRSHLGDVKVLDNLKQPEIICGEFTAEYITYYTNDYANYDCEILRVTDSDGHVWLEVGTNNTEDYYPWFVASWYPKENV